MAETRNPDDDFQRTRMELALREASYDVHSARLTVADDFLDGAEKIAKDLLNRKVPEEEKSEAIATATLFATLGGAMATSIEVGYMLEQEQSNLQHARAHVDHEDTQRARREHQTETLRDALETAAAEMRAGGVNAEATPQGIVIHPPADDQ